MLHEFEELEVRDAKLAERVTKVIAHLLRFQFVHSDDRGSPSLLETLRRPGVTRLIADFFEVAGYRLIVREVEGWAGILPDLDRISPPRMRIDETLLLLVLRRRWEEGVRSGETLAGGAVLLTLNEAYAAYTEVVSLGRRPAMNVAAFREVLQSLERHAVVRLGEFDREASDMELTIRPLVTVVTGDVFLAQLEQLLQGADSDREQAEAETETKA